VSWLLLNARSASIVASVMLIGFAVMRPFNRRWAQFASAACFEVALVLGMFAFWQIANHLARGHTTGGYQRGEALWHVERVLHLPSERAVQDLITGYPPIVRLTNYYYDTMHFTMMVVFLVWLWLRHRDRYPYFRNVMVAFTAMSLLMQMIAVAPPRLIAGTGLIDTAQYYHQSVYAQFGDLTNQYAALPSIHVGWALLIGYAVATSSTSRGRWVGPAHAAITVFVVVATANHYWMDGIVALWLLVLAGFAATGFERLKQRLAVAAPVRLPILTAPQVES
jgi:hypothetical protein